MTKTPNIQKIRQSLKTPKTQPKKLKRLSTAMMDAAEPKRTNLNFEAGSSVVESYCTPARTTRSMLRTVSNDMPPPSPISYYETPSKRRTIAKAKSSAKKSVIREKHDEDAIEQNDNSDGAFLRPLALKSKKNDSLIGESTEPKRKSTRGRKAAKVPRKESMAAESSEDDMPSVSMLGSDLLFGAQKAGQYVRARKSVQIKESVVESSEEDLPSVGVLGGGQYVRSRTWAKNNNSALGSSEDDLPSVSILGDQSIRSRKSAQLEEAAVKSSEDDLPSVSLLGNDLMSDMPNGKGERSRKSKQRNSIQAEVNSEGMPSMGNKNTSVQFVRSRKSMKLEVAPVDSSGDDLPSVSLLGKAVLFDEQNGQPTGHRKSKEIKSDKTDSSGEDLPSISMLDTGNSVQSRKTIENSEAVVESSEKDEKSVRRSAKRTPSKIVDSSKADSGNTEHKALEQTQKNDTDRTNGNSDTNMIHDDQSKIEEVCSAVSVTKMDTETDNNEEKMAEIIEDLPKICKKKPLIKNRVSIIDLTDSPAVANRSVLNKTFSPDKDGKDEAKEAMDRTFTEENGENDENLAFNDKTFSPMLSPGLKNTSTAKKSSTAKKLVMTPMQRKFASPSVLKSAPKSAIKKKSPQLKRLQGTPLRKPTSRSNLNTPGKLSSAKKTKIAEATAELIGQPKTKHPNNFAIPNIVVDSPKVYKFGTESNNGHQFRFSLVAPHMKAADPPQNNKSNVKPAPNFGNMHSRMFNKAESLTEVRNRHEHRAKLLLSGKKPSQAQIKAEKSNEQSLRKLKNVREIREERRPLANINQARLNDEERQERRKQLFKQGSKNQSTVKKNLVVGIKGVRLNRRFELMMKNRDAAKNK